MPSNLTDLMNVGKSVAAYFERAGITRIDQLTGQDPVDLYNTICQIDAHHHDPTAGELSIASAGSPTPAAARPRTRSTERRNASADATTHPPTAEHRMPASRPGTPTARRTPVGPAYPQVR